jgi:hypothetical protein
MKRLIAYSQCPITSYKSRNTNAFDVNTNGSTERMGRKNRSQSIVLHVKAAYGILKEVAGFNE